MPIEGDSFAALDRATPRRPQKPRRNISRCSAIAASGTAAGRRWPIIRRARRSKTTNGSCFTSTGISPRSDDLAAREPERLAELIKLWWSEAERHKVLPLDDRFAPRFAENAARFQGARNHFVFHAGMGHVPTDVAPDVRSRSYAIEAHVEIGEAGAEGVLICPWRRHLGLQPLRQGRLSGSRPQYRRRPSRSSAPSREVPSGAHRLGVRVERLVRDTAPAKGARTGVSAYTLLIDGEPAGSLRTAARLPQPDLVVRPRHRPGSRQPGVALRRAVRIHRKIAAGDGRDARTTRSSTATASAAPRWRGSRRVANSE